MKKIFWMTLPALALLLAACGSLSAPAATPPPVVAVANENTTSPAVDVVVASAVALPEHQAEMSFAISAPVKEILVKKGDTVKAGQPLMILSTPDLEFAVQEAEWSTRSAESLFARAKDPYKKVFNEDKVLYAAGYVEKRNEMQARLQAEQAGLDAAKYKLALGTFLAPFDGIVVDVNIEPSEFAQTGQVVMTLADLAHMQIETTDLSERDVPAVQIGQTANIYIEALDVLVTGKVSKISPISETVGGDVVYPVTIELDERPDGLLWGMSAEVEIQTK
jgi:RND family efflux transporter MFP subunit